MIKLFISQPKKEWKKTTQGAVFYGSRSLRHKETQQSLSHFEGDLLKM